MKYSIIIPTFNSQKWIQECIGSVFSQTCKDFNIIILDSGSTDGTLDYVHSLNNDQIKIYSADKRLNIEENWSRITSISRNEFMTILGHDDMLYPDFLETIDQLIAANPGAAVYHTHFNFIDHKGLVNRRCKPMKIQYDASSLLASFFTADIEMMATGYVIRSKDYDRIGGIPSFPGLLYADFALWLKACSGGHLAVSEKTCFAFRVHQSVTSTSSDKKLQTSFEIFLSFLKKYTEASPALKEVKEKYGAPFLERYIKSFAHRMLRTKFNRRDRVTVKQFIAKAKEKYPQLLGISSSLHPEKNKSVQAAIWIDKFAISRNLFMLFRKAIKKPRVD